MKRSLERREAMLQILKQQSFASVSDLARRLGCSQMTVRRDLERLSAEGIIERTHGGASAGRRVTLEFSMGEQADVRRDEKAAIARAAAALVRPGQRIIIDTGTTTLALARELRGRERITVVTTSLAVVSSLLCADGIECMLLGGTVRESSPDLYGPLVEENLSRIHPDWAFIGCDGISLAGGLTTSDARVARATSLMIAAADRATLLCDSSKAGRDAFVTFAAIDDLDVLITDRGMSAEILDAARASDVETIIVEAPKGA
ncbi:MAG TPA: DeoR/GlpR family DNA-binding transcription regulator [Planctomycetota bacterium]|nr:DeoR/GlpR family DNA-binding transcription regulator [Planctomycetota bacterium]